MIKISSIANRMTICVIFIAILFLYVIVWAHHVQITRHEELLKKAKSKYITSRKTSGKRGEIFDKRGSLLVGNLPCFNVCADPTLTGTEAECRELAKLLAPHIDEPQEEIFAKLMKKTRTVRRKDGSTVELPNKYVVLRKQLDYDEGRVLQDLLSEQKCKSIIMEETVKRFYPKQQLLSNVLGITTHDRDHYIALVGVEKFYNSKMTSKQGKVYYERTRKGAPIAYGERTVEQEVKDGLNIYLTVDEAIQTILEEELDELYNGKFKPKACYAVMIDPWSGDVLAIAERPTFDPNQRKAGGIFRNRIAEDVFEPGSTMKPVTVSGAIDLGIVTPDTIIDCGKRARIYGGKLLNDTHYIGRATVADVLKESSNIGTAEIGLAMGKYRIDNTFRAFGFGARTGIPLKPESRGIYSPPNKWGIVRTTRVCIGQGVAVTSLQMARAYCMLANGGRPLKLNLVDRIEDPATGKIEKIERKLGKSIFKNPETHMKMVRMMCRISSRGGTGAKASIKGYHVAGKTGTAQKAVPGGYSKQFYVSNFVGFAPAYNPRFVLMVVADSPEKRAGYYASSVVAPVFKNIAERTLQYMGVPRDFEPEEYQKNIIRKKKKTASLKRR